MKKILVTGGLGYIGSVLSAELIHCGYSVSILDKGIFGTAILEDIGNAELIQKDFREITVDELKEFEIVLHLAGLSNDPMANFNPTANDEINHHGAVGLAQLCEEAGIERFLFASSASIYGFDESVLLTEESPVDPKSFYAEAKLKAENGIKQVGEGGKLKPTYLRQSTVMGASCRERYDLVVNTMCKDAFTRGLITLVSGGECWRPLVNVIDLAVAWIKIMEAPIEIVENKIFNIVHKNYRVSELGNYVKHCINTVDHEAPVDVIADYTQKEVRSYKISGEKFENAFGKDIIVTGVLKTVQELWRIIKAEHPTRQSILHPRHYNIEYLNFLVEAEKFFSKTKAVF